MTIREVARIRHQKSRQQSEALELETAHSNGAIQMVLLIEKLRMVSTRSSEWAFPYAQKRAEKNVK